MEGYLSRLLSAKNTMEIDFIMHEVADDTALNIGEYMFISSLANELRSKL